ncbi:unnamed protein product [Aspergillus oryzae]|uniref:Unnamed protein product n=2 Tax=Aspergillus oryzae TaxID=5062 RepID=A0AAN4YWQ3_ASPOZ|nr:unnamed protein product [Aspergillus oryzae]GMF88989.1 unnamed protein product [Aspergillus oryzae]GMG36949.1 unnamed protein product [Aspergillus oryzae]
MHYGQVVDLDAGFAALTADIVTTYFYGQNFDYLGNEGFKFQVRDAILGLIQFYHFTRFFPWIANTIKKLPIPIMRLIHPGAAYLVSSQEEIKDSIRASLDKGNKADAKSVIVQALEDPTIPPQERTLDRLGDEGTTIIFAGTETTARALSVGMFHILNNKTILKKLREELDTLPGVSSGVYSHVQLECLPYLVSCIFPFLLHPLVSFSFPWKNGRITVRHECNYGPNSVGRPERFKRVFGFPMAQQSDSPELQMTRP